MNEIPDDPLQSALERLWDNWTQIMSRSGPIYVTAKERSKAVADAYRAAGSPAKVYGALGSAAHLAAPWDREKRIVPATPEQAAAWRAWTSKRERLRRELKSGKPTYVDAATARETAASSTVTPEDASAAIDRRIDELGLRDEVEAARAEYEDLQQPTHVPGLGIVSGLAAQMLATYQPFREVPGPFSRCYSIGVATVHVRPWCTCPPGRR